MDSGTLSTESIRSAKGPYYDRRTVRLIHRFLVAMQTEIEAKRESIKAMAGKDIGHPLFAGQMTYCRHALGCIRYMAKRATEVQHHLLLISEEEIILREQLWELESSTSDEQRLSLPDVCTTQALPASGTDGDLSQSGQQANSVTQTELRSGHTSKGARKPSRSPGVSRKRRERGK